jgi:hypothetical protein
MQFIKKISMGLKTKRKRIKDHSILLTGVKKYLIVKANIAVATKYKSICSIKIA